MLGGQLRATHAFRRYASTSTGATVLFYFNRLSPPLGLLNLIAPRRKPQTIQNTVQKALGSAGKVLEVTPRPAEGGAFVRIEVPDGNTAKLHELATSGFTTRWLLMPHLARGAEVLGRPWITDIPRTLSRVVEVSPTLPDEDCYELLRPYGRIHSVKDGKVTFFTRQDAITASFCAHRARFQLDGQPEPTFVRLRLAPSVSWAHRSKEWFKGHPRVLLPFVSLLLLSAIYAVFEPVREISVHMKISNTFSVFQRYFEWARMSTRSLSPWGSKDHSSLAEPPSDWNQLDSQADLLRRYLDEAAPTFIAIVGPEGSGKSTVVRTTLNRMKTTPPVLEISCEQLKDSDPNLLYRLAANLGYRPNLLWANRIMKVAEVAIKGLTGQSSEISESTDQQMERMLHTTAKVLRKIALKNFRMKDVDSGYTPAEGDARSISTVSDRGLKEAAYLEAYPDQRPVVVLNQFNSTERSCELLARWAAELVQGNVARVVCVSQDTAFDKSLTMALPNRVFRIIRAEDAAPHAARQYILNLLEQNVETQRSTEEFMLKNSDFLEPLGGRFSDLQSFGRRLLNGETPQQAMESLVHAAALEVLQLFLTENKDWTVEQAWRLITMLGQSPQQTRGTQSLQGAGSWLSVTGSVASQPEFNVYSGPTQQTDLESVLHAMDNAGMLCLRSVGGRVTGVKPARPLFRAAFYELQQNPLISNYMEARGAKSAVQREQAKVKTAETELCTLMEIKNGGAGSAVAARIQYVTSQLQSAQQRLMNAASMQAIAEANLKEHKWLETADDSQFT